MILPLVQRYPEQTFPFLYLKEKKLMQSFNSRQYLTSRERILPKANDDHRFGETYEIEEVTVISQRKCKLKRKTSRERQPLNTRPRERKGIDQQMSHQRYIFL